MGKGGQLYKASGVPLWARVDWPASRRASGVSLLDVVEWPTRRASEMSILDVEWPASCRASGVPLWARGDSFIKLPGCLCGQGWIGLLLAGLPGCLFWTWWNGLLVGLPKCLS